MRRGFLLALLALPAFSQAATLDWTAPLDNTDGTPITEALTYAVYESTGGVYAAVKRDFSGTSLTLKVAPGTHCFKIVAIEAASRSARSNIVCKTF